ncbi:MAG: TIGR03766 family XrtG-associated glycosyltransferase [Enterococcus sp.]
MKKLYNLGVHTIQFFWIILFGLTVFFALLSPNIILGDNPIFGTSTTLLTTVFILMSIGIVALLVTFEKLRKKVASVFIAHKYVAASSLLVLVFLLQVIFVYFVHPGAGFDAGMLHYAATNKESIFDPNVRGYFSLNQNNLPPMLLMHWIVKVTGQTSWQFFDYLTVLFVDLSVLLNLVTIKIVAPKALAFGMYLQAIWLLVFPSILMPYTDTWALPLVSGYLLCYFLLQSDTVHGGVRGLSGVLFGVLVVLTYFIKPSAIIPVIAIVLVNVLSACTHKITLKKIMWYFLFISMIGAVSFGTYRAITSLIAEQTYIKIDDSRNIPAIHFASMGISGDGGYSEKQAEQMAILPTKEEKSEYSKKIILKRLKELHIVGYLQFLVKKQERNTADGTFGWLKEGNFFRENQKPSQKGIRNQLKNFIFLYGAHIADFRFFAQLVWLFCLLVILLGWGTPTKEILILKLSLIGAFVFLLLFEGGRSRYMIQYLPCFILLAALAWETTKKHIQQVLYWWENGQGETISKNG